MMLDYIKKVFRDKDRLGYEKVYIFVDIHGTILEPSWDKEESYLYLGKAKEVLQEFSKRSDVVLIIWSASYPEKLEEYRRKFEEDGINFTYSNNNPEVVSGRVSCFDTKPYYDILIDDKAGFYWTEWEEILRWIVNLSD